MPVVTWVRKLMEGVAHDVTREMAKRSCLILAPHPDDEVLGCGGTIARKVGQGVDVFVVFLTDGRYGLRASAEEARAVREEEARNAATLLGLPPSHLTFLRFEDSCLSDHVDEATTHVQRIVKAVQVDEMFVPYCKEFHPDHVAAWKVGMASRCNGMRLYEYPIWYGPWLWPGLSLVSQMATLRHLAVSLRSIKVCVSEVADIKRRAFEAHRSQVIGFQSWQGGSRYLSTFFGHYELFFPSH